MLKKHYLALFIPLALTACDLSNLNLTITDSNDGSSVDVPEENDSSNGGDNPNLPTPPEDLGPLVIPEGAKRVTGATFSFADDFEGEQDNSFWGGSDRGSAYTRFGAEDATDVYNRVLAFDYTVQGDGADAWSQQDFHLPQVTEMAFLYRLYTPSNYTNSDNSGNHKLLVSWSGEYGTFNEGLHVSSEMWNASDDSGKVPSMYIGVNPAGTSGDNRGHVVRASGNEELAVKWEDGTWHDMYIYFKAAAAPGEYGSLEIWRDGVKLISTDDDLSILGGGWWIENRRSPSELIGYAEGTNFIEYGYLMGWWNKANITDTVTFQIDDLTVLAK